MFQKRFQLAKRFLELLQSFYDKLRTQSDGESARKDDIVIMAGAIRMSVSEWEVQFQMGLFSASLRFYKSSEADLFIVPSLSSLLLVNPAN
tara:strand:- start:5842 stop:6114 length:273 start_codon:yes stop_codon:yes gene_type:complete